MLARLIIAALSLVLAAIGLRFSPENGPIRKASPTYAADIVPILNRSCVNCHRPGEIGPFSLVGYENAKKWSKMVASVAESKQMPPWKDTAQGVFQDENRLSADEISTLQIWQSNGSPRGNAKSEPKSPQFSSGWTLGEPDLIVSPEKAVKVGAEGKDEYRNFVIKTNFPETRYLAAMDCKPGNKSIVHHLVVYVDESGTAIRLEKTKGDGQGGYITEGGISPGFNPVSVPYIWVPGLRPRFMPRGVGYELKPGATLVMQMHYHKDGKPETDLTKLGLYFAKEKPSKLASLGAVIDFMLKVPAGKVTNWEKNWTAPEDMTMYSIMPHMHLLGQSMRAELTTPDGVTRLLVNVEQWDYNWQFNYSFKEPVKIPKGSKIHVVASYNNTTANPRNPTSPPKDARWGEQTTDEMFVLIFTVTEGL